MAGIKKIKQRKLKKDIVVLEEGKSDNNNQEKIVLDKEYKGRKKKIKSKRIRMSYTEEEEKELDKAIEEADNFSVTLMIVILLICFLIGIPLGYLLYRIAINGSSVMAITRFFLK